MHGLKSRRRRRHLSALGKMSANKAGGTGKHWINSILPAPESFYDKDASLKFVASPAAVASYSLLLYGLSGGAFAALLGFYSHPSQHLSETVVQSSWSRPGFECAPLQNDPHYGVNYSYTECLANIVEPSAASVNLVSSVWKYTPLGNSRAIKSTESTVGIRAQNDTIKNVTSQVVLGHGTEIRVSEAQGHVYYSGPYTGISACPDWTQSSEYRCTFEPSDQVCRCRTSFDDTIDQNEAIEIYTYITNKLGDSICDFAKTNSPFQCTRKQPIEAMQRVSLSYAGAILVYSGLSVFFSWLMQYRKARIEKLRKVVASKGIVLTPENQESTV